MIKKLKNGSKLERSENSRDFDELIEGHRELLIAIGRL